jgi:hypothetical protein
MNSSVIKIKDLLLEAQKAADEIFPGSNILYNEGYVELLTSDILGHTWNTDTQGGDAVEPDGTPTEYKAINVRCKSKGSFQWHWLSDNKIAKLKRTKNMYLIIRSGVEIQEIYRLPTATLLKRLEEKATGSKSIHGHVSLSLKQAVELGATKVYSAEVLA